MVATHALIFTSISRGEEKTMRKAILASAIAILGVSGAYAQSAFVRPLTNTETALQEQCFAALAVADKAAKQGAQKSADHGPNGCGPWETYVRTHQKSLFGDQGN
jgi:hypothetical protein